MAALVESTESVELTAEVPVDSAFVADTSARNRCSRIRRHRSCRCTFPHRRRRCRPGTIGGANAARRQPTGVRSAASRGVGSRRWLQCTIRRSTRWRARTSVNLLQWSKHKVRSHNVLLALEHSA